MRDFSTGIEWLSINTATLRQQWTLPKSSNLERHGIGAISPWRDQVAACGLHVASRLIRETGIKLSGYCRGGMFPAADDAGLAAALTDNFRAVDEACELGSSCLVLVVGALPGALEGRVADRDIGRSRAQVFDGIARLLDSARPRKMPVAINPCIRCTPRIAPGEHTRAGFGYLRCARPVDQRRARRRGGHLSHLVGSGASPSRSPAGARRLLAFHVCDWLPTPICCSPRNDGRRGDRHPQDPRLDGAAGYAGFSEVEIFSARNWWQRPGDEVLATCAERHRTVV